MIDNVSTIDNKQLADLIAYAVSLIPPGKSALPSQPLLTNNVNVVDNPSLDLDLDNLPAIVNNSQALAPAASPALSLNDQQAGFLVKRLQGLSIIDIQTNMALSPVSLVIWQRNALFSACMSVLKEADALQAKAMNVHKATKDPDAFLERAFFIKAIDPSYRDNVMPPNNTQTNVHVTIAGKDFDVSASYSPGHDDNG